MIVIGTQADSEDFASKSNSFPEERHVTNVTKLSPQRAASKYTAATAVETSQVGMRDSTLITIEQQ